MKNHFNDRFIVGIGFGLAEALINNGHTVIVSGRRQEKLAEAKNKLPQLITIRGDVETEEGRETLFSNVTTQYPDVNVLINNAGVFATNADEIKERSEWNIIQSQLRINVEGTIHLSYLFVPHLKLKPQSLILIVSSIVGLIPLSNALAYSTSKAALHHFSVGLRLQLRDTSIKVAEALPGPVDTDMLVEQYKPIASSVKDYVADVISHLNKGDQEFALTGSPFDGITRFTPEVLDQFFVNFNQ